MRIVGGVYRERSVFPQGDVLYGSGGRAAAALRELCSDITLTTFVGRQRSGDLRYFAKEWRVTLDDIVVESSVSFDYYHGLSAPVIRPTRLPLADAPRLERTGDVILQFGMLEGDVIVHGKRVVFDPQNPESPRYFDDQGSTAGELAYILNRGEAARLTGESEICDAAAELLARKNVKVVVIKCGAYGAQVFENGGSCTIPAYETPRVWPIGSGDVFAAVFAFLWGKERRPAVEAAGFASRAASLYCGKMQIPLRPTELFSEPFTYPPLRLTKSPAESHIYLAGPFFTMGQLWLVEEAADALRHAGFQVFSPFHDVGLGDADAVVEKDIQGIERADVLFALCDGLDPGTLFEVGYAVKLGIPVVAFGENTTEESMKMLRGTGCKIFSDFTTAIYHAKWEALR